MPISLRTAATLLLQLLQLMMLTMPNAVVT